MHYGFLRLNYVFSECEFLPLNLDVDIKLFKREFKLLLFYIMLVKFILILKLTGKLSRLYPTYSLHLLVYYVGKPCKMCTIPIFIPLFVKQLCRSATQRLFTVNSKAF